MSDRSEHSPWPTGINQKSTQGGRRVELKWRGLVQSRKEASDRKKWNNKASRHGGPESPFGDQAEQGPGQGQTKRGGARGLVRKTQSDNRTSGVFEWSGARRKKKKDFVLFDMQCTHTCFHTSLYSCPLPEKFGLDSLSAPAPRRAGAEWPGPQTQSSKAVAAAFPAAPVQLLWVRGRRGG